MNCCDDFGNCNQGRDCPIRVTKARPVMLAADPLPPSAWRPNLRYLTEWVLMSLVGVLWLAFLATCVYFYATL
jgi:hypothetical protein